jgi:hypothetical protein
MQAALVVLRDRSNRESLRTVANRRGVDPSTRGECDEKNSPIPISYRILLVLL